MRTNRRLSALSGAVAATAVTLAVGSSGALATVAFDGSASYTQNFDNLTQANSTASTGQRPWVDDTALPAAGNSTSNTNSLLGWYVQQSANVGATTGNYQRVRANGGGSFGNTGGIYSYGPPTGSVTPNTNRALGILESTTVGTEYVALRLQNTSGQAITSFTLSYTGEQFWVGTLTSNQALAFGYKVEAGSVQDSSFTAASALSFTSPKNATSNGAGGVGVDGTTAAYQTAIGSTITGLDWEPGQDLWLRWQGPGPVSGSHGLAIDNLTFSGTLSGSASTTADPTWKADAGGTWDGSDATNWLNGKMPAGGTVRLGSQLTADRTVTLATSPTVTTLELNGGAHNYTLAATGGNQLNVVAGGSIVTDGVAFNADNTPSNGNQITAPLNFATDAYFRVNDPLGKLTVTGNITVGAGGGLHLAGAGSVSLPAAFTWSGPTTLDGVTLSVSAPGQLGDGSPSNTVNIVNGGGINFTADVTLNRPVSFNGDGGLTAGSSVNLGAALGAPATSIFTKTGSGTVSASTLGLGAVYLVGSPSTASAGVLQILPSASAPASTAASKIAFFRAQTDGTGLYLGRLDLTNGALVIDYTGTTPLTNSISFTSAAGTVLGSGTKIATALWYAYDGGAWDRTGITSSYANSAANDPNKVHSVAYAEAKDVLGLTGAQTATWHGQTVDATSILLMYTVAGDANMNGVIDPDDFAILDRSIAKGTFNTGSAHNNAGDAGKYGQWINGDFNYDGAVDLSDLKILDTSLFYQGGGQFDPGTLAERQAEFGDAYVAGLIAAVPEPSALVVACGLGGVPLVRRRRRGGR